MSTRLERYLGFSNEFRLVKEVSKHQSGTHDQLSHGNWADGGANYDNLVQQNLNYDTDRRLRQSQDESRKSLTWDEKNALQNYFQIGYSVNNHARGYESSHGEMLGKYVKAMDSAIEKVSPLPETVIGYRGVSGGVMKTITQLKAGDVITDDGFMSVSLDNLVAGDFAKAALLEIEIPKGTKGFVTTGGSKEELLRASSTEPSTINTEREIILPRKTRLEFVADDGQLDVRYPEGALFARPEGTRKIQKIRMRVVN